MDGSLSKLENPQITSHLRQGQRVFNMARVAACTLVGSDFEKAMFIRFLLDLMFGCENPIAIVGTGIFT